MEENPESEADIILLTPDMVIDNVKSNLEDRVNFIKEVGTEKGLCIADVYEIWKNFRDDGIKILDMLPNKINHPTILGHEVYAIELMKLFE